MIVLKRQGSFSADEAGVAFPEGAEKHVIDQIPATAQISELSLVVRIALMGRTQQSEQPPAPSEPHGLCWPHPSRGKHKPSGKVHFNDCFDIYPIATFAEGRGGEQGFAGTTSFWVKPLGSLQRLHISDVGDVITDSAVVQESSIAFAAGQELLV